MVNNNRYPPVGNENDGNATIYFITCAHRNNLQEERDKLAKVAKNAGCDVFCVVEGTGCFSFVTPPGTPNPFQDLKDEDVYVQSKPLKNYVPVDEGEPELPALAGTS